MCSLVISETAYSQSTSKQQAGGTVYKNECSSHMHYRPCFNLVENRQVRRRSIPKSQITLNINNLGRLHPIIPDTQKIDWPNILTSDVIIHWRPRASCLTRHMDLLNSALSLHSAHLYGILKLDRVY